MGAAEFFAGGELDTTTPRYDPGDGDAGGDDRPGLAGSVAQVEGDHAHAAADVSPHAGHPAQAAGGVVEADGRRARVEGAGVGADHALAEVGRLQALVC